jgi:uncharacterized protein (DUF1330 family)
MIPKSGYVDAQSKLIQKHGGHYIIRGGKILASLSGTPPTGRYTVYLFNSQEKMQAWRDDPGQKGALGVRDKVAKFRSFAVEGLARWPHRPRSHFLAFDAQVRQAAASPVANFGFKAALES